MSLTSQTYSEAELLTDLREINKGLERLEAEVVDDVDMIHSMSERLD